MLHYGWPSKPFIYSILVTASLASKTVHLFSHRHSLPILLFTLYLPTFLLPEFLLATVARLLLPSRNTGSCAVTAASAVVALLSLVTLFASASQIAFYLETGGEVRWSAARNFAHDPAGVKLLASGSWGIAVAIAGMTCLATLLSPWLYLRVGAALALVGNVFGGPARGRGWSDEVLPNHHVQAYQDEPVDDAGVAWLDEKLPDVPPSPGKTFAWRLGIVAAVAVVGLLQVLRPKRSPFGHMSCGLPFSLYQIFDTSELAGCQAYAGARPFPKPELIRDPPNETNVDTHLPFWLPPETTPGFERWYWRPGNGSVAPEQWQPYSPQHDPLKISNLGNPIFETLRQALDKDSILIKHVVLFHLESTRQDAFPLQNDSHLHDLILKETGAFDGVAALNTKLAQISSNAELLTGVSTGMGPSRHKDPSGWRRYLDETKGGINVVGSVTAGTATLKSLLGSVCGVDPLPVDFTEEAGLSIYQPCLPHVLNLLSRNKTTRGLQQQDTTDSAEYRESVLARPWHSVHAQAITDQFDRQDILNVKMGFKQTLARSSLMDPVSQHFPPHEPESNYFGYPEPELKPYLRDVFVNAEKQGRRVFLSHLTSTTHHPWHVPESYGVDEEYLSRWHWREERPLNAYLNTLRYQDQWIGDFMDLLEELDIFNETLIVFAGDHGMAFREDCEALTTFENPHIVNFRVPLLFFHPRLPRLQLNVTSTSLSILPTVLDLLSHTGSFNAEDQAATRDLIRAYEGQSLLRPYIDQEDGREAWQFSVINAGAALLSVASAAVPWRLVMPLCKPAPYRFTNLQEDPAELRPIEFWSMSELLLAVLTSAGPQAAAWVGDAEQMGLWWASEQKRKWQYTGASRQDDKAPGRHRGVGQLQYDHWWNT